MNKTSSRLTSLLSFVFFFSGFAALMYQVAWQRLLTVHYGVGAISITLIVSVYMFGMGLGALFGGFLSERIESKIIFYFVVELLIGCFGFISLPFLDYLGRNTAGSSYVLSFFYMFLFLSIPTVLMGITLPLLTKIFNAIVKDFLDSVSFLYFINTIGAALGAVFTSYVVISFWGLDVAVYCAVVINLILAGLIFAAKSFPVGQQEAQRVPNPHEIIDGFPAKVAYLLVFITGFLAIGYEIVWFRVIGILVKASPYAFSSVLSVYLTGIALGSYGMSRYLRNHESVNRKSLFFLLQFLIGIYVIFVFVGYYYATEHTFLSFFTRESYFNQLHPLFKVPSFDTVKVFLKDTYKILDVFFWPIVFIFIPTVFMGASFPLISFLALSQRDKEGKTVGTVYFYNIAGNVLGGVVTGFILLPYIGTEYTLLGFSIIGILFGLFVKRFATMQLMVVKRVAITLGVMIIAILFFPGQGQLYETMHIPYFDSEVNESYFEEGVDGTTIIHRQKEKYWNYINGLLHGFWPSAGYYYQVVEVAGHTPKVENVLVIGYGIGSITEAVLKIDTLQNVTLIELNHSLIKNLKKIQFFKDQLTHKKLNLVIDDGRRFLLGTDETYDLIIIDPLRSTTAYSNNLYSQQFFTLVKEHLNPNGVFMLWMDEFKVMPKTVLSVFEHVQLYDFFCVASRMPFTNNDQQRQRLFDSFSKENQEAILRWKSRETKRSGDPGYIIDRLKSYPVNQDWKPVAEYYIGLKVKEMFSGSAANE